MAEHIVKPPTIHRQVLALLRRYWTSLMRYPISSVLRILLWPAFCLTSFIYTLAVIKGEPNQMTQSIQFEQWISFQLTLILASHIYHFLAWLVGDKTKEMKSLMLMMNLKKVSYYLANSTFIILTILPSILIVYIASVTLLFEDSQTSLFAIAILFLLFTLHLSGLIQTLASLAYSTTIVNLVFILILFEAFIHQGIIWLAPKVDESFHPVLFFIGSLSPFESIRILSDSYVACKNCHESKFYPDRGLISQPTYLIIYAMMFWSIIAHSFAVWWDEVCPYKNDTEIKSPCFCCKSSVDNSELINLNQVDETSKYFEKPASESKEIGIRISKVTKRFKSIPVVNDLSFDIYNGETTLLLGHNGAGKTTLMNILLGKLTPNQGQIRIFNLRGYENHPPSRDTGPSIGVCPQTSILDENLSVWSHLELFIDLKCSGMSNSSRSAHIRETLKDVGLDQHSRKLPYELSGGMKRKLSLAMAFIGRSRVLILDEPSSGLDPESRVFVWNAIRRYRGNRTVLLSSQHMEEADYLGDRIAIMNAGSIVCCGSSVFLNELFGSGYKLRVECAISHESDILKMVRKFFEAASLAKGDMVDSKPANQYRDLIIQLKDNQTDGSESKLIHMLEFIEANQSSLQIRSFGLKSSSIEEVMLNTSKIFTDTRSENIDNRLTSFIGTTQNSKSSKASSQMTLLRAFMLKHLQTYFWDYKMVIYMRFLIATYCIFEVTRRINKQIYSPSVLPVFITIHFVQYPSLERVTGFKIVQLSSHAKTLTYWLAQFLSDSIFIAIHLCILILLLAFTYDGEFVESKFIVYLLACCGFCLFLVASILLAYVISTIGSSAETSMTYYLVYHFVGAIFLLPLTILKIFYLDEIDWLLRVIDKILLVLPSDAMQYFFFGFRAQCFTTELGENCKKLDYTSPLLIGSFALILQIITFSSLLFLIERFNFDLSWYLRPRNIFYKVVHEHQDSRELDKDVLEETAKAEDAMLHGPRDTFSLVTLNLCKSFLKGIKVVNKLSFTVERGECFGLLGVNGAGKSTTFSMLASETKADSGEIWSGGKLRDESQQTYRHKIAYDPQSNPDINLSPRQALVLMARLRGIKEEKIQNLNQSLFTLLEMEEHIDKTSKNLSGGTKRKLALAMAVIGYQPLILLDEPTAGVDPMARRKAWQLLRTMRGEVGSSIVISSHAMEECEAICDRISIMSLGRLRCIGSFLHLRSEFSRGSSIRVQFNEASSNPSIQKSLERSLTAVVGSTVQLTDTNLNSATFNIADNHTPRSVIFKALSEFKKQNSSITYTVNDSSLEDIFIALAREQQQLSGLNADTKLKIICC